MATEVRNLVIPGLVIPTPAVLTPQIPDLAASEADIAVPEIHLPSTYLPPSFSGENARYFRSEYGKCDYLDLPNLTVYLPVKDSGSFEIWLSSKNWQFFLKYFRFSVSRKKPVLKTDLLEFYIFDHRIVNPTDSDEFIMGRLIRAGTNSVDIFPPDHIYLLNLPNFRIEYNNYGAWHDFVSLPFDRNIVTGNYWSKR